ncbi:transporter substrate-binding domain-containing protein [Psychromonas sp. SP041]|uniref:transporter substrate-binding domain-containing protein n=1 Tax=Psychromonas sp. SP041 TaxID=1365007 RepID=UPI00040DC4CE|nr:transporter substrate-binding domain-containing protein [Psychromonas sp. SP041]
MLKLTILMITILSIIFSSVGHAKEKSVVPISPKKIIVWQHTIDNPTKVIMQILNQALDITKEEYGDYEIVSSIPMEQRRAISKLSKKHKGELDIAHFASSESREKSAIAVRIPLLEGLLGYRVCLIRKNHQYKFFNINNMQDFIDKNITIGQQQDWLDTKILKNNGLNVQTSYKYSLLFRQLEKQRFDCFLRGINEIGDELELQKNSNLVVENNLLFHYPFPLFFFVNGDRPDLAERLTVGLTSLQEKGVLTQLLEDYFKDKLEALHLNTRKVFHLENSFISEQSLHSINTIPWLPL